MRDTPPVQFNNKSCFISAGIPRNSMMLRFTIVDVAPSSRLVTFLFRCVDVQLYIEMWPREIDLSVHDKILWPNCNCSLNQTSQLSSALEERNLFDATLYDVWINIRLRHNLTVVYISYRSVDRDRPDTFCYSLLLTIVVQMTFLWNQEIHPIHGTWFYTHNTSSRCQKNFLLLCLKWTISNGRMMFDEY